MDSSAKICVMGIGNILLMDEGVGPYVVKRLQEQYVFPSSVQVQDCATMGLALLPIFEKFDYIVTVDAVDDPELEPGTVVSFAPDDIAPRAAGPVASAHEMTFADVLGAARMLNYKCEGHCVGVQVENMSPSEFYIGLSPAVEAAVPQMIETVLGMLWQLGVRGIVDKQTGQEVVAPGDPSGEL